MKQREHQQKTKKEKRKEREGSPSPLAKKKNVRALRLQRVPDGGTADGLHVRLRQDARARGAEREDRVRR